MGVYLICIGSNYCKERNLLLAREQLTAIFPSIKYGDELETTPENMTNPALFLNQVARFSSSLPMDEVSPTLKELEKLAGRTPESKQKQEIPLDIDILMYNDTVIRPEDMKKDYVIQGIQSLNKIDR